MCECCNEKFYTKSHKSFNFHLTKQMGDNANANTAQMRSSHYEKLRAHAHQRTYHVMLIFNKHTNIHKLISVLNIKNKNLEFS